MRHRWFWAVGLTALAAVGLAAAGYLYANASALGPPITVGLLHSLTGPRSAVERNQLDAEILSLEEINAEGGVLGRPIKWVVADGRSDPSAFAQQAQHLVTGEKVCTVFGGGPPYCRRALLPVVEENDGLLVYTEPAEGLEHSPNVLYGGGSANQRVCPGVTWCVDVLGARTFYLVGSDTVRPHVQNALAGDQAKALGGRVVGEEYLTAAGDYSALAGRIKAAAPDVVLNALDGEANVALFDALALAGLGGGGKPAVLSFGVSEEELRVFPLKNAAGSYAATNYLQAVDREEGAALSRRFKARFGADRVTADAAVAAYESVKIWAQALREAGTDDPAKIRKALRRQSFNAPGAVTSVDPENQYNWRPFFVGKVRPDRLFDLAYTIAKPVHPEPYPATRTRADWNALINGLSARWGGRFYNPAQAAAGPG